MDVLFPESTGFSADKQKLLEYLLEEAGVESLQMQITPAQRPTELPLSFAQQRLWLLDQVEPGNLAYTIFAAVHLAGALDLPALAHSLNTIIQRHEILRTTFTVIDGQPVQRITAATPCALPLVDLCLLSETEREEAVQRLIDVALQQPFDLAQGPLLRTSLLRLSADQHVLLMSMHHIISDGWSMGIFVREIAALYDAFSQSKPVPLPELPIQYADFALWQRGWLQRESDHAGSPLQTQLAYWRTQLDEAPPLLELPTDRPRPALQTFRGATHRFAISELPAALTSLGNQNGATLSMTLLAAFQALLYRYSGQADINVGSPIANRVRMETEQLIGFFVNTLVLRGDLSGDPTFVELLGRVREVALDAYAHQDLPFELLLEELRPERTPSHTPLFQVMFVLQNAPLPALAFSGLTLSPLVVDSRTAKFDLTLTVEESEQGLLGALEYNCDLFDAATIARMAGHVRTMLASIVAMPVQHLADLPLLTAAERQQLLAEWRIPQEILAPDACIHQLFEMQAARIPDAIALVYETNDEGRMTKEEVSGFVVRPSSFVAHVTYRELNRRANQLAHELRRLGAGPEMLVGICMERSLEMVIGILGVLKAGAAYVPLDPTYPPERLAFMLADAQVAVLLTATSDQDKETRRSGDKEIVQLPVSLSPGLLVSQTVVDLVVDWPMIAQQPETNPHSGVRAENLAYVIYTSGSTGTPKSSLVCHANLVRLFEATQSWFHVDERDVWSLFHSYAFDFSVWELWGALRYGGRLVVVPYWASRSPTAFYDLLCRNNVTVLNQTPSAFRQLTRADETAQVIGGLRLRLVIFGGEALELQSLRPWFERHGDQSPQLVNMYGITETTIHVTYRPLTLADLDTPAGSVIGGAIPDLGIAILDSRLQPVPIGIPGELYVGGAGLARGYLNRPELTAERFVPNPFAEVSGAGYWVSEDKLPDTRYPTPGTRLYKTGDRVRRLSNGDIEYLGRVDQQVKIRGFRIELGEITAALTQHPTVQEAVVVARQSATRADEHQDRRLVAYVVPAETLNDERRTLNGPEWSSSAFSVQRSALGADLRPFLKAKLPDYMVPASFVVLDALPLTSNGKVNLGALPTPDSTRLRSDEDLVAPRTPTERTLADIWARVLGLKQVGINETFFDLGGDSIRGIQVVAQAEQSELSFSLRQLFQHQTISALARELDQGAGERLETSSIAPFSLIAHTDRQALADDFEDAYPLSMLQLGMLFHSVYTSDTAVYHNITSLHLRAPFDAEKLQTAIQELSARHPMLRTSFDLNHFSEPLQLVHRAVHIPVEIADLSALTPAEQAAALTAWFESQKARRFDWTQPPLVRFAIHRRCAQTFQLSWCEHHAILDGWSVATMITELCQHYLRLLSVASQPITAAPSLTYAEFVTLERQAITSEASQRYWIAKLRDSSLTPLPRWPVAQAEGSSRYVRIVNVPIAADLAEGLSRLALAAGAPLKSVLLAAHLRVLSVLSGQADILTGLVSNGRPEAADGERLLGLFLNTVPFRLKLAGGTWLDLVRATFAAEQELLPFRRYPLAQLQKLIDRQPLFETLFNFVHFHIYQSVAGIAGVQVLGEQSFQETNFTFVANFSIDPSSSQLHLRLEGDAIQLGDEQMTTIGEYYVTALAAMVGEPDRRYEAHDLLSTQERDRLLIDWNDTRADYVRPACIHQWFEEQATRSPDAIAVVFENQQISYSHLNGCANQLAHYLRRHGVGPDVLVGVCMERSLELMIGILGILKAGGAYVPLDPAYPQERRAFMLDDAQVAMLVTTTAVVETARRAVSTTAVVDLQADWPTIARQPTSNLTSQAVAANLAYVIYTSGSTGQPKGVAITHQNVVHSINARFAYYHEPVSGFLLLSSVAFDSSVVGIFWTLCQGGMLVLPQPNREPDLQHLADQIRQRGISHLLCVPSLYSLLLAQAELQPFSRLHAALMAGEPCLAPLIERHRTLLPQTALFNEYGPTEATVWSSVYDCRGHQLSLSVPIGRPIANTQLYILNAALRPVPIGSIGEIAIGGDGLARGYLGRPELTAEKFIPNPFASGGDKETRRQGDKEIQQSAICNLQSAISYRLYKTGDLARYLPDGNIEFLGRIDGQVKVRGFRIELGEIEAALGQHPALREAVVVAREDVPGDRRLVAYVVTTDDERRKTNEIVSVETQNIASVRQIAAERDPSIVLRPSSFVTELRAFLSEQLPNYMLPSAFMVLDALPLMPNGKVDRRALPVPEPMRPELVAAYVAPETELDQAIAQVWRELLRIEHVGIHDNFFELGGDSLLLVQAHSRLRDAVQCDLAMVDLFRYPTISALSSYLNQDRREHASLQESYERAETRRASRQRRRRSSNG